MEYCGVYEALKVIGNKWSLLILRQLCTNPKGFNELLRLVEPISPKVLSERLKEMVASGLVHKEVFATNPPTVMYSVTQKGNELKPIITQLNKWGATLEPTARP